MKEKHIENLAKGKKSGANIGSRGVPHRLNQHEQRQFDIAIKRRYLTLSFDSRPNLRNIWLKYAEAKQWSCLIMHRKQDGTATVEHDLSKLHFDDYKQASSYMKDAVVR